ncbi:MULTISPECIES: hypothetical protein [Mycobacteriaceae]|uniref:Uncharacterized protein n=1 Tax=Mycolicibacterium grossiae TaxID=1552759 RepID=A0A1E8Q2U6_9MYCO|nr:hypothetical protein [Mycolicibacterium grossiae]OFJ52234.1 hypothetical protein BEL07_18385 [Mycolicibacterium grossiae]
MSMPSQGMSDASQQVGAQYVASVRDDLLAKLLEQARFGTLDPEWRSSVMSAKARLYPHAVTDDDRAAVMELQQLPPQAWEPYRAPWRVALDAWFIAQFGVNERARVRSAQTYVSLLETQGMTALSKFTVASLTGTYTDESVIDELTTLPYAELRDPNTPVHMAQRDELVASYLAGLNDGGVSNDWAAWLRARSVAWSHPMLENKWRIMLSGPTLAQMWRLPDYWRDAE